MRDRREARLNNSARSSGGAHKLTNGPPYGAISSLVRALARQPGEHVGKRSVASAGQIFPPGDETIPWIPDNRKPKIPGGGRFVFRTQHSIVHKVPIRVGKVEIERVNDRRSSAFSLVDENALIGVTDHYPVSTITDLMNALSPAARRTLALLPYFF